jgi:hypothetical protein
MTAEIDDVTQARLALLRERLGDDSLRALAGAMFDLVGDDPVDARHPCRIHHGGRQSRSTAALHRGGGIAAEWLVVRACHADPALPRGARRGWYATADGALIMGPGFRVFSFAEAAARRVAEAIEDSGLATGRSWLA